MASLASKITAILFLICVVQQITAAGVGCLGEDGNPVDWWVILKYPYLTKSADATARSGYGYSYADAKSQTIKYTGLRLDQNVKGALGATITQVREKKSTTGYLLYDDAAPDNMQSFGHTKGVVGFDKLGGFWLVHSVPRFPMEQTYTYPEYAKNNGQSFLCVTYPFSTFDTIGAQLQLNNPYVFESNLPKSMDGLLPHIEDVLAGNFTKRKSASNVAALQSKGGDTFLSFAKNSASKLNLYEDFVEPTLGTGLMIETWMNGPNPDKMPTTCPPQSQYKSINIRSVTINNDITWPETKDHSKWAVSIDTPDIYCIGDINRQYSQAARGGGTICANNTAIWKSLSGFITTADQC